MVGAITPDWGDPASQAGHPSQSGGALGGWKFANIKDGVFAEYFHVNEADANMAHIPDAVVRRSRGLLLRHALDRLHGGRKRQHPHRRHGRGLRAGTGRADGDRRGPAARRGTGHWRRLGANAPGSGALLWRRRDRRSREGGRRRTHHGSDRRRGVDSAIEALGGDEPFQNAISVTKPGGTISNAGYHGKGEFVHIPRLEWGVGMAEKTIRTGLCPGGRLRMERLLRLLRSGRVDPTRMTTHTFRFAELERAFDMMDRKLDGIIKPLITF